MTGVAVATLVSPACGVVTPHGAVVQLLGQIAALHGSGNTGAIAQTLFDLAGEARVLGNRSLASRCDRVAKAMEEGMPCSQWERSPLRQELTAFAGQLADGVPVEVVFGREAAAPPAIVPTPTGYRRADLFGPRAPSRTQLGPAPVIRWGKFSTPTHELHPPPPEADASAGLRLSYLAFRVAFGAGYETDTSAAKLFGTNVQAMGHLGKGEFVPNDAARFPTEVAGALILKTHEFEPAWAGLMQELIVHAAFEAYNWPLGEPGRDTLWHIALLFGLRRYFVLSLLTEESRRGVLADMTLRRVVSGENHLDEVRWHAVPTEGSPSSRTRREVFDPWLSGMATMYGLMQQRKPEDVLREQTQFLGDGIMRSRGWKPPKEGANASLLLQWAVKRWLSYHLYGSIPSRGLPPPWTTDNIRRFALATSPRINTREEALALIVMLGDFLTNGEKEYLEQQINKDGALKKRGV